MKKAAHFAIVSAVAMFAATASSADAPAPQSPQQIVEKSFEADPWGLGDAVVKAHAVLTDKKGSTSQLAFSARSRRHSGPLSKTIVRFSAPADLAGAGFLQVQNRDSDDDRHLFLPDLKKSRRIAGSLRANAFMGTDFSFADLDRRDWRESQASAKADETIANHPCYHLQLATKRADSPYSRLELWVRKDNFLPLQMTMFDRADVLVKTLTAEEVKRVSGRWFISKTKMVDHRQSHTTELFIDSLATTTSITDDEFTVRNLEKL